MGWGKGTEKGKEEGTAAEGKEKKRKATYKEKVLIQAQKRKDIHGL